MVVALLMQAKMMMRIKNMDGLSAEALQQAVNRGARFVYFPYNFSLIVATFRRTSGVYLLHNRKNSFRKALPFIAISLFFGCWGIPWGPKYTFENIRTCLAGGKDVTAEVMDTINGYCLFREAEQQRKARQQQYPT